MGSAVSITANILAVGDNFSYLLCNPATTKAIDCSKATVKGEWFFQPYICAMGICFKKFATALEAGDSAIQAVEVLMDDGESFLLNGALTDYVDKCNACCGATPVLTPITIPAWVPCDDICPDEDGNRTFHLLFPTLYGEQTATLTFYADNALIGTSTSLATPAAALAYAISNWSAQGDWTLVGNVLTLVSPTVKCINGVVTFESHDYCLTVSYPFTFDSVIRSGDNGAAQEFPLPGPVTVANKDQLASALTSPINYFSDGTVTSAVAGKVQYSGTGDPITLNYLGAVVGTWATTACS